MNLVAQGAIKEGMLSVLAYKKSLFAGVLDGGREKSFSAARGIPALAHQAMAMPVLASASASGGQGDQSHQSARTSAAAGTTAPGAIENRPPSTDSWASLLTAGLKLVESLTAASNGNGHGAAAGTGSGWMETDAETGRTYVKLPVPDPQVLQTLADSLSRLVTGLRKK